MPNGESTKVFPEKVIRGINISVGTMISIFALLLISVLIAFAITIYVMETKEGFQNTWFNNVNNRQGLLDPVFNIENNMCSKACCGPSYGLQPYEPNSEIVEQVRKGEFVPNNMYCNNSFQDAGCMCMTKKQANILSTRGGNSK